MGNRYVLTSESISEGHPDKVADQIADAILDLYLAADPHARVFCETVITEGKVIVAGDVSSIVPVPEEKIEAAIREVVRDVGYGDPVWGFGADAFVLQNDLNNRCEDGYNGEQQEDNEADAGRQGIVFGYATDETREKMPLPIQLAHRLMNRHAEVRRAGELPWLGPSAKVQVTVSYKNGVPSKVEQVTLATRCNATGNGASLREALVEAIINPVVREPWRARDMGCLVSPVGSRGNGRTGIHIGVSGRRVASDTYGGSCPNGGGGLSGKDPTRLERFAAYAVRQVAKNLVAAGIARRCTVQLGYALGKARPVTMNIDFHGTGRVPEIETMAVVNRVFDLSQSGTINRLQLLRPIYRHSSVYGHYGKEKDPYTWENADQADVLRGLVAVALSSKDCPSIFVAL